MISKLGLIYLMLASTFLFSVDGRRSGSTVVHYNLAGSAGDVVTFDLPSSTPVGASCFAHPPDCFGVSPVTATINGSVYSGLEVEFFGSSEFGGIGLEQGDENPEWIHTFGPLLFSGSTTSPTLLLGSFNVTTDTCCGALLTDPTWVVTVSSTSGGGGGGGWNWSAPLG
jgi:hypothetical protein